MSPAGAEHGEIAIRLGAIVFNHVHARRLGKVCAAETGFVISRDPDTVRAPDVAFVKADRLPARTPRGFFEGPPDLAVEVVSPDDRAKQVAAKVGDWLAAGAEQVWVVDPRALSVVVHSRHGPAAVDEIDGGTLLPGLRLPVADIFV